MRKVFITLCSLFVGCFFSMAQRFPVQVIPQINSPSPVNFYSYADATTINSPIGLQLALNDITIVNRQIRLKVYFEGNGINFQSKDFVIGADPLFVTGGVPLRLNNTQLAPYFEFQNIEGINPNVYRNTIPEGSYQFCFEIFDYTTGNRLSSKTCRTTFVFSNEPPLLNLPLNRNNITPGAVENIVFQWTPRHINVSNVEYELSIVEVWDEYVDPQTVFQSVPPVFQTTTRGTTFIYGPGQPLLLSDKKYAWRVKAKALQGVEEIGLFRNEGYSEIFWFTRTEPCGVPNSVTAQPQGTSKINVYWEENPAIYSEYIIRYREANKPGAAWFTIRTNSAWATIWHLKPSTTYDYQVAAKCKFEESEFSEIQRVTTDTEEDETADYNCGIVPDNVAITNRDPHPRLKAGDRITAGDFIITLTDITSQSSGIISGKGFVQIPYLKYARFAVVYDNVLVNSDNQLAQGEIVTVNDGKFGEGDEIVVDVEIDPKETVHGDQGGITEVSVDFEVEEIRTNENGGIEVIGTNGEVGNLPGGKDTVITDSNGDVYTVSEDGNVTQGEMAPGGPVVADNGGSGEASPGGGDDIGVRVDFIKSGVYSYDDAPEVESNKLLAEYPTTKLGSDTYTIPFKAVSKLHGDDIIKAVAHVTNSEYKTNDIIFKTKEGIKIPATWEGDEAVLNLKQTFDYVIQNIFATIPSKDDHTKHKVVGTFNLVHLNSALSNIELVLIPINNASISNGVAGQINDIYNKSGVNFNIKVAPPLELPDKLWNANGLLDVGDSGHLSYYTSEERNIIDAYKAENNVNSSTYYLFVSDLPVSNAEVNGFMPLKSQFGFVFGSSNQARIAAHELGHGVFGLEHIFETYSTPEGATNFLMDYGTGTRLAHMDWKKMYAPGFKLYWFQGDEAGESNSDKNEIITSKIHKLLTYIKGQYNAQDETLPWRSLLRNTKRNNRNRRLYVSLEKTFKVDFENQSLAFKVKSHPGNDSENLKIIPGREKLRIETNILRTDVAYELELHTETEKIVFEFDHHDELETFCNVLKIGRERVHTVPNESKFSKEVVAYLQDNFLPEQILPAFCETLDLYLAEAPSDLIKQTSEEVLWKYMKALLYSYCTVDDKGVSEEAILINLLEALQSKGADALLEGLISRKAFSGDSMFKALYKKIDNWNGEENFTKFINTLYGIWASSSKSSAIAVDDIPYKSKKQWGFYSSQFGVSLNQEYTQVTLKTTKGRRHKIKHFTYGPYHIFDPISLTEYDKVKEVAGNLQVPSVKVPSFIIAGIAQNQNTHNTSRTANLTLDAALTFSGIGNVSKLRYLRQLGKLKAKESMELVSGISTSMAVVNFMLEYSGKCNDKTAYCTKLKEYLSLVEASLSLGTNYAFLLNRKSKEVLEEIEKGNHNIDNAAELEAIKKELKALAGQPASTILKELHLLNNTGKLASVPIKVADVTLTLSTVSFLLKYTDCQEAWCKETLQYLGYVQKAIAAKGVADRAIAKAAEILNKKIQKDEGAFGDKNNREKVLKELQGVIKTMSSSRLNKLKTKLKKLRPHCK